MQFLEIFLLRVSGGHLDVLQLLAKHCADLDSQDNRGISCLMAAFRKGHIKVVKWLVKHAKQFPADPDCKRFMQTVSDKVSEIMFENVDVFVIHPHEQTYIISCLEICDSRLRYLWVEVLICLM